MPVPSRTRAGRVLAGALTVPGLLLGVVGVVAAPSLVPCWIVVGAVAAGAVYARDVERVRAGKPMDRKVRRDLSVAVGSATLVGCLVVVALVFLLGAVSGPVILLLVLAAALWMWRHRARPQVVPAAAPRPVTEAVVAAEASTTELCLAWRRSYLELLDTPSGPDRDRIVGLRRDLLDELHRRDPDGFSRWIDTGARAGGDPGRYLGTGG